MKVGYTEFGKPARGGARAVRRGPRALIGSLAQAEPGRRDRNTAPLLHQS